MDRAARETLARARLVRILAKHKVASARTLEQKIADAGPFNQRVDPHILTIARADLEKNGTVKKLQRSIPWYHLSGTPLPLVEDRLKELEPIHEALNRQQFNMRLGQTLEIAVFRALRDQTKFDFLGSFIDLDEHDDSALYRKEEPPSSLSGKTIPKNRKFDFVIHTSSAGYAGIEVKNVREWLYPGSEEVQEFLLKCCSVNAVPVLVARRIPFVTFKILNACGGIVHQTYNQLFPLSEKDLAAKASNKDLLGYHDIRLGNIPDARLQKFLHTDLPNLLDGARSRFADLKDLVELYANGTMTYAEFAKELLHGDEPSQDYDPDYS